MILLGSLAKSIVLNVPVEVAYSSMKNVDPTRHEGAEGMSHKFTEDVPNKLLAFETAGSWGKYYHYECSFRPLTDSSCEVTISLEFKGFSENVLMLIVASDITGFLMLEYGYRKGQQGTARKGEADQSESSNQPRPSEA